MELEPCRYLAAAGSAALALMLSVVPAGAVAPPVQGFSMDPGVAIAIVGMITALGTVTAPLVLNYMNNRHRREEIKEKEAREDLVAQRVAEAADQAKKSAEEMVEATRIAAEASRIRQSRIEGQLQEIHALGNSTLTTQYQITLTATKAHLVTLQDAIDGRKISKRPPPSSEMLLAVEALRKNVEDQEKALAERLRITEQAAQSKQAHNAATVATPGVSADGALLDAADKMAGAANTMERAVDKAESSLDKLTKK